MGKIKYLFIGLGLVAVFIILANLTNNTDNNVPLPPIDNFTTPVHLNSKLGVVPTSPDADISLIPSAFIDSRENGIENLYWFFNWKDNSQNWNTADLIMGYLKDGGGSIVTLQVVSTMNLGSYPSGWNSFTDDGFAEEFAVFAGEFAGRYKPDYILIGNEVNDYLRLHPKDADEYEKVINLAVKEIKKKSPGTRTGITISASTLFEYNQEDLVRDLSRDVDLVAYNVYGHQDNFQFVNPQDGIDILNEVESVVPGKAFAITETGWSSSESLGSSEEKQAEYVELLKTYVDESDVEFVNYFLYRDGKDCSNYARSFFPNPSDADNNPEQFKVFQDFLCTLGLKNSDGSAKLAWDVIGS